MPQPLAHAIIRWQLRYDLYTQEILRAENEKKQAQTKAEEQRVIEQIQELLRQRSALGPSPLARM